MQSTCVNASLKLIKHALNRLEVWEGGRKGLNFGFTSKESSEFAADKEAQQRSGNKKPLSFMSNSHWGERKSHYVQLPGKALTDLSLKSELDKRASLASTPSSSLGRSPREHQGAGKRCESWQLTSGLHRHLAKSVMQPLRSQPGR